MEIVKALLSTVPSAVKVSATDPRLQEALRLSQARLKMFEKSQEASSSGDKARARVLLKRSERITEHTANCYLKAVRTESRIDLHGFRVPEVKQIIQKRVQKLEPKTGQLSVIVGRGSHSENGKSVLGPVVKDVCGKLNVSCTVANGGGMLILKALTEESAETKKKRKSKMAAESVSKEKLKVTSKVTPAPKKVAAVPTAKAETKKKTHTAIRLEECSKIEVAAIDGVSSQNTPTIVAPSVKRSNVPEKLQQLQSAVCMRCRSSTSVSTPTLRMTLKHFAKSLRHARLGFTCALCMIYGRFFERS